MKQQKEDCFQMKTFNIFSYLRSLVLLLVIPLYTVIMSLLFILISFLPNSRNFQNKVIRAWATGSCWLSGVNVQVSGVEEIPDGSCLFLFNHSSFADIFSMCAVIPDFRFGAKIELFSIPFFGKAMARAGVLPIVRENRGAVLKVYKDAVSRAQMGERFALSPEGTRQNDEKKLGSFKSGPFLFALDAQIPLVPVVIEGASLVLPKGKFLVNKINWNTTIKIKILEAISVKEYTYKNRNELKEYVRNIFIENRP